MSADGSVIETTEASPGVPRRVALMGSPNSGKSTLFNALTGLRVKVANYPGATVEQVEGTMALPGGASCTLIDLPGSYSLAPLSPEEHVAVDMLHGRVEGCPAPEAVLFVTDSTSLPRSLPLVGSLLAEFDAPVILVLTMIDELKARGGKVRPIELQKALGIPVLGVVGNRGIGIDDLRALVAQPDKWQRKPEAPLPPADADERFPWADAILEKAYEAPTEGTPLTDKLDKILLHPVWGLLLFAAVMVFFFQAIFLWAAPLQELMEAGVGGLGKLFSGMPDGLPRRLIVDGVIGGVGSVVVFVPQIALLFLLLSFLEQVGYMSRAVFLIDRLMGWVGLDGRSFVSMLSCYACAVPGIMAARNIPDPRNRLVTILVAPLMTCAARLPVYALLIAAFIPAVTVWGVFSLQGLVMLGLYLLGAFGGLLGALLLRRGPLRGRTMPFYIELPPYRLPTLKTMARSVWSPVWRFLRRAGTLILAASIILWFLLHFPSTPVPTSVKKKGKQAVASFKIEKSYAAKAGKIIEPLIAPLGFDWRVGIGLVASLAAREVIVATMAQTYAIKTKGDSTKALSKALPALLKPPGATRHTRTQSLAVALSLLMFFVFALQCVSTLAVMHRETGSWKWPAISFVSLLGLAYVSSFVTYRLALWIGGA